MMILSIACPDEATLARVSHARCSQGPGGEFRGPEAVNRASARGDERNPPPCRLAPRLRPPAFALLLSPHRPGRPRGWTSRQFARDLPKIASGEPILSFNGRDLTGFYVFTRDHGYDDPKRVVQVVAKDGQVVISRARNSGP